MYKYSFEKLEVWQLSVALVKDIYGITNTFPSKEKFGLISQINRSAVSVPSNIAEGTSRNSTRDRAHFTNIAYGSMMELITQLIISKELNYVDDINYKNIRIKAEEITNKLNALRNYQKT